MRPVLSQLATATLLAGWAGALVLAALVVGPIVAAGFATLARPHIG